MRHFALALILTGTLAVAGHAQVIYQTSFSDSTGWTLDLPSGKKPGWDVDHNPVSTPFGAFRSAPDSLNFNNRLDYKGSTIPGKQASSPPIDLAQVAGIPVLTFWCNNQSEEGLCDPVHEGLQVFVVGNSTVSQCLNRPGQCCVNPATCTDTGWHEHVLVLDKSMGVVVVEFRLRHDSLILNDTAGWFIDDLELRDYPAPVTYCSAKVNSQGCLPVISYVGQASATAWVTPDFLITATQVINNRDEIFFYGLSGQASIPFQGERCVPDLRASGHRSRTPEAIRCPAIARACSRSASPPGSRAASIPPSRLASSSMASSGIGTLGLRSTRA